MTEVRVLFLASNPNGTAQIGFDRDHREVEQGLRGLGVQLKVALAVKRKELVSLLMDESCEIIHFSAHGTVDGTLLFEGPNGERQPVGIDGLVGLLALPEPKPRLAVFMACDSVVFAQAATGRVDNAIEHVDHKNKHIDHAIGMIGKLDDTAAIVFSATLYESLARGCSIAKAVEAARLALKLEPPQQEEIPELVTAHPA